MGNRNSGRKRTVCTHPRERGEACVECRRERQRRARRRNRVGIRCEECGRPLVEHGVTEFHTGGRRATSLLAGRVIGFETTPKYIDQEYI